MDAEDSILHYRWSLLGEALTELRLYNLALMCIRRATRYAYDADEAEYDYHVRAARLMTKKGRFDQAHRHLELAGNIVVMHHDSRLPLCLERAELAIEEKDASAVRRELEQIHKLQQQDGGALVASLFWQKTLRDLNGKLALLEGDFARANGAYLAICRDRHAENASYKLHQERVTLAWAIKIPGDDQRQRQLRYIELSLKRIFTNLRHVPGDILQLFWGFEDQARMRTNRD